METATKSDLAFWAFLIMGTVGNFTGYRFWGWVYLVIAIVIGIVEGIFWTKK